MQTLLPATVKPIPWIAFLLPLLCFWIWQPPAAAEQDISLPPPPPDVEAFNIEDLIKAAEREKSLRGDWAKYQVRLEEAFEKIILLEEKSGDTVASNIAWERFVTTFNADNPYSTKDDELLSKAKIKLHKRADSTSVEVPPETASLAESQSEDSSEEHVGTTSSDSADALKSSGQTMREAASEVEAAIGVSFNQSTGEMVTPAVEDLSFTYFAQKDQFLEALINNIGSTSIPSRFPKFASRLGDEANVSVLFELVYSLPTTSDPALDQGIRLENETLKLAAEFLTDDVSNVSALFEKYRWYRFERIDSGEFALSTRTLILSSLGKPTFWKFKDNFGYREKPPKFLQVFLREVEEFKANSSDNLVGNSKVLTPLVKQGLKTQYFTGLSDYVIAGVAEDFLTDGGTVSSKTTDWVLWAANYFRLRRLATSAPYRGWGDSSVSRNLARRGELLVERLIDQLEPSADEEAIDELVRAYQAKRDIYLSTRDFEEAIESQEKVVFLLESQKQPNVYFQVAEKVALADLYILASKPNLAAALYTDVWQFGSGIDSKKDNLIAKNFYPPKLILPLAVTPRYLDEVPQGLEDGDSMFASLTIRVGTDGKPSSTSIESFNVSAWDQRRARRNARYFRFRPALKNGTPISAEVEITQEFLIRSSAG